MKKVFFVAFLLAGFSLCFADNHSDSVPSDSSESTSPALQDDSLSSSVPVEAKLKRLLEADFKTYIKSNVESINSNVDSVSKHTIPKELFGCEIDWINFWTSFLAFLFSGFSVLFTFKTANSVKRMSKNVQLAQFDDLIRHLYRNLVCSLAFSRVILQDEQHKRYPSEEHLLKLKVLPEDVLHLDRYNHDKAVYAKMHELKLLLRNYDVEIETAMMHLKDKQIPNAVLQNDLDTLTFKPFYLINAILGIIDTMESGTRQGKQRQIVAHAAKIITTEHFKKAGENIPSLSEEKFLWFEKVIPDWDTPVAKPYDGLRRALRILRDRAEKKQTSVQVLLNLEEKKAYDALWTALYPEKPEEKDAAKRPYLAEASRKYYDHVVETAKGATFALDFYPYILTAVSLDVDIEMGKIHTIELF